jgi:hypothetical protein
MSNKGSWHCFHQLKRQRCGQNSFRLVVCEACQPFIEYSTKSAFYISEDIGNADVGCLGHPVLLSDHTPAPSLG